MAIVLLMVSLKRDLGIFIKLNSYGVMFTLTIIIFVISVGVYSLGNTEYSLDEAANVLNSEVRYIELSSLHFAPLLGLMSGGFYFHNLSIPILKNASDPTKNVRNVFIGYFLAFFSYVICGILGYVGFLGSYFNQNDLPRQISQNCLNMFSSSHIIAFVIRSCVLLLLLALFPLLIAL